MSPRLYTCLKSIDIGLPLKFPLPPKITVPSVTCPCDVSATITVVVGRLVSENLQLTDLRWCVDRYWVLYLYCVMSSCDRQTSWWIVCASEAYARHARKLGNFVARQSCLSEVVKLLTSGAANFLDINHLYSSLISHFVAELWSIREPMNFSYAF